MKSFDHFLSRLFVFVLMVMLSFSSRAQEKNKYGNQNLAHKRSEGNPIIPGFFADPSIAKFGDTYYLYTTTDGFGWETGRWVIWKSKDLVNWSFSGESFPEITGKSNWAPGKPVFRNGKYWLPFTLYGKANYLAVADKPEGPFHFANNGAPLTSGIDSEILIDDDNTPYYIAKATTPIIFKLKDDLSAINGAPLTELHYNRGYVEGAFLFKRNKIYYAASANLGYAEYRIIYGMSDKIQGPYIFPKDNIIIQPNPEDKLWGTGHGHVFQTGKKEDYILVYLRSRMGERVDPFQTDGNVYRQICLEHLKFNVDGTIKSMLPTRNGVGLITKSTSKGKNLAIGATATASSSLINYEAKQAIDGGFGTRWIVNSEHKKDLTWWKLDLGKIENLKRTEIFFNYPTEITPYILEYSIDNEKWFSYAEHISDQVYESPKVDSKAVRARYFRITFIDNKNNKIPAGLWEFKAYNK